jgi:hypothetical protein
MIGASVGVVWFPIPTKAWVRASKIVFRLISGGIVFENVLLGPGELPRWGVTGGSAPASSTVVLIVCSRRRLYPAGDA